eukprot:jgi/Mesvir1/17521/Mv08774-RA.1
MGGKPKQMRRPPDEPEHRILNADIRRATSGDSVLAAMLGSPHARRNNVRLHPSTIAAALSRLAELEGANVDGAALGEPRLQYLTRQLRAETVLAPQDFSEHDITIIFWGVARFSPSFRRPIFHLLERLEALLLHRGLLYFPASHLVTIAESICFMTTEVGPHRSLGTRFFVAFEAELSMNADRLATCPTAFLVQLLLALLTHPPGPVAPYPPHGISLCHSLSAELLLRGLGELSCTDLARLLAAYEEKEKFWVARDRRPSHTTPAWRALEMARAAAAQRAITWVVPGPGEPARPASSGGSASFSEGVAAVASGVEEGDAGRMASILVNNSSKGPCIPSPAVAPAGWMGGDLHMPAGGNGHGARVPGSPHSKLAAWQGVNTYGDDNVMCR